MISEDETKRQTDCITALISDTTMQDISFVFRVGYEAGLEMISYLQFDLSQTDTVEARNDILTGR
jgi:hypothetical protein